MKKRYQVFVSSTYTDLLEERSKVIESLLKLDCIPAGMELFPAADEGAWEIIKQVIDECDYYLLILAGRYGSRAADGTGYTALEYRYAIEKKKPIIAFLHANPGKIPQDRCEADPEARTKLEAFRRLVRQKLVRTWNDKHELASEVTTSLVDLKYRHPAIGWVRADQVPPDDVLTETIRLQKRVQELEGKLAELAEGPPPGSKHLEHGSDSIELKFEVTLPKKDGQKEGASQTVTVIATYDEVLRSIAKQLLESPTEAALGKDLVGTFREKVLRSLTVPDVAGLLISTDTLERLRIQFRALGIVTWTKETRERYATSSSGGKFPLGGSYSFFQWYLTPYGDRIVTQLLAKRRGG